jgi:hypothetical protein
MIGRLAPLVLLAASTALGGCYVSEERVAYVRAVPEQDAAEIVEVSPGPGSVYVAGHWEWNGARYKWVHAHYLRRPAANLSWVEGHWQDTPQGWYWQEGHWTDAKAKLPRPYPPRHVRPAPAPQPADPGQGPDGEALPNDPNVPPAPTYAPPPPPAVIPPPPGGAVQPQHYIQPPRQQQTNIGY